MDNLDEIGGEVFTWGSGEMGQLGLSPSEITKLSKDSDGFPYQSIPTTVKALSPHKIVQVAGGDGHSLAVTTNGKVFAWGASACGQLGLSKIEEMPKDSEGYPYHPEPRLIESLGDLIIIMVACGDAHSAALTSDGIVLTWGGGGCGQLGHPDTSAMPKDEDGCPFQPEPRVVDNLNVGVRHICCGKAHTVAVTEEGLLYTWGAGACGQLGHPDTSVFPFDEDGYPYHPTPKLVAALKYVKLTMAACGDVHTLVLSEDGAIYCFGGGSFGQLGLGIIKNLPVDVDDCPFMPVPKQIENLRKMKIVYIACGDSHSMALTHAGEVYSWGAAACGQLGLEELDFLPRDADDSPYQPLPSLIAKLKGKQVVFVACGEAHTLVLTSTGIVYSFGASNCGQLGVNSLIPDQSKVRIPRFQRESEPKIVSYQPVPKLVSALLSKKVLSLACGGVHNVIVTESPPKSIAMDLYPYYKQPRFTDFTFIIRNNNREETLQCHKVVIASRSSYFRELILSASSLQLEYSKRVVSKLLEYFYLDDIDILTESISYQGFSQLLEYLSFAHKYQLVELVEVCQYLLMQKLRPYIPEPLPIQETMMKGLLFLPDGRAAILPPDAYTRMLGEAIVLESHNNEIPDNSVKNAHPLGTSLLQELNVKDFSDVVLMVENKPIYSHRVVLACRSQYFSALYCHGFREAKEGVVEIGGVTYDEMVGVLKYIYCDELSIDLKGINEILTLCERFSLVSLKARCELALINSLMVENVALLFKYSKNYSCGKLKQSCLVFMQENYEEVLKTAAFEDLDKDSLLEIMRWSKS